MKTSNQWYSELTAGRMTKIAFVDAQDIEDIQLDAAKRALEMSANHIRKEIESHDCRNRCDTCIAKHNSMIDIQSLRDNLTIEELSK